MIGVLSNDLALAKYYYYVKPLIPRRLQLLMRRWVVSMKRRRCGEIWPIDRKAGKPPQSWPGWPEGKRFALVLTHDVDTLKGHDRCSSLMNLEKSLGFRSSFNFVAADYRVSSDLRRNLMDSGFEVGLHGLVHNRKLYESKTTFEQHAIQINDYMKKWGAVGFRSPCMYHNLEWICGLDIEYDASTFDTDPFEPQPDGVGTIFPFYVEGTGGRKGYVELPYTLPQDFTLFVLLKEKNIDIWERKVKWIAERGGMVLLNTHPDYMDFTGRPRFDEYPADYYTDFLALVKSRYDGEYWHVLPKEVASYWTSITCRGLQAGGTAPGSSVKAEQLAG